MGVHDYLTLYFTSFLYILIVASLKKNVSFQRINSMSKNEFLSKHLCFFKSDKTFDYSLLGSSPTANCIKASWDSVSQGWAHLSVPGLYLTVNILVNPSESSSTQECMCMATADLLINITHTTFLYKYIIYHWHQKFCNIQSTFLFLWYKILGVPIKWLFEYLARSSLLDF